MAAAGIEGQPLIRLLPPFGHLPLLLNSWEFFFQYFNQNLSLLSEGWFTQLLSGFIIKYQNLKILSMLTENFSHP